MMCIQIIVLNYTCTVIYYTHRARKRVLLVFEGVDTVALITLNGNVVGKTDNMFRRYVGIFNLRWIDLKDCCSVINVLYS